MILKNLGIIKTNYFSARMSTIVHKCSECSEDPKSPQDKIWCHFCGVTLCSKCVHKRTCICGRYVFGNICDGCLKTLTKFKYCDHCEPCCVCKVRSPDMKVIKCDRCKHIVCIEHYDQKLFCKRGGAGGDDILMCDLCRYGKCEKCGKVKYMMNAQQKSLCLWCEPELIGVYMCQFCDEKVGVVIKCRKCDLFLCLNCSKKHVH